MDEAYGCVRAVCTRVFEDCLLCDVTLNEEMLVLLRHTWPCYHTNRFPCSPYFIFLVFVKENVAHHYTALVSFVSAKTTTHIIQVYSQYPT